jgi:aspartyl protease family protein
MRRTLCALSLMLCAPWAAAQSVALSGMMGERALLVVDGTPPKALAPGETHRGVKLLSAAADQAVVEIKGQRQTLQVGAAPVSVTGASGGASRGNRIVLQAGAGGHFTTLGSINGRSVQFVVDTGATFVALSVADAERVGLNYQSGQPVRMSTANGLANGWRLSLQSLRIGDVEVAGVEAVVTPQAMPYVLLGNSYLTRFQMHRENEQMTLERRY